MQTRWVICFVLKMVIARNSSEWFGRINKIPFSFFSQILLFKHISLTIRLRTGSFKATYDPVSIRPVGSLTVYDLTVVVVAYLVMTKLRNRQSLFPLQTLLSICGCYPLLSEDLVLLMMFMFVLQEKGKIKSVRMKGKSLNTLIYWYKMGFWRNWKYFYLLMAKVPQRLKIRKNNNFNLKLL